MISIADFETTTDKEDCRVWGWAYYDIQHDVTLYGNDVDNFMWNHVLEMPDKSVIYFHNLKFDGEFLFYWLFDNGFIHSKEKKLYNMEFGTLISWLGQFYSITIKYQNRTYRIMDSLKIIPLKVSQMSEAFGHEQLKGEINYKKYREIGYQPDETEIAYMKNDVEIVGKSLRYFFDQGLTRMTQASNAMNDFKSGMGSKVFKYNFPLLDCDRFLRDSYKGGFVYVNPKFQGEIINDGVVLDVNSLYPYVMYDCKLPWGEPVKFDGDPYKSIDKFYDLFVVTFTCQFKVKKDHIPCLQIKGNKIFGDREYLTSSNDEDVSLTLTSVDLELFLEHYDVENLEYEFGYKFMSSKMLFREYIDKWTAVKEQATRDKNNGLRTIAKLMLNALYGKFGTNPVTKQKYPYYEDGYVKYVHGDREDKDPVYVALASFVTSYARAITIRSAQKNYNRFIYADTDSLHLEGKEIPDLWVDNVKRGAWKIEGYFNKGKFLRAKSYIEQYEMSQNDYIAIKDDEDKFYHYSILDTKKVNHIHVTVAGMPYTCHKHVTFENFKSGSEFEGKLQAKRVKGGVVIDETTYTLQL